MLANIVGVIGERGEAARDRVAWLLQRMPHGPTQEPPEIHAFSDGCIGWRPIVWGRRPSGRSGIVSLDDGALVVAIDGRLDATEALATQCGVDPFDFASLVAQGYRRHGEGLFARLEGDFACVVWHRATRRILLARDFCGARPIYWSRPSRDRFVFASNGLATLRCSGLPLQLDRIAIWQEALRVNGAPTPNFIEGVKLLPRFTSLVLDEGGAVRLSAIAAEPLPLSLSDDDLVGAYREALLESVRRRVAVVDGFPSVTVSGGLDSASVLGATRAVLGPAAPIHAITVVPYGKARADMPFARDVVELARAIWFQKESRLDEPPLDVIRWSDNPYTAASAGNLLDSVIAARKSGSQLLLVGAAGDYLGGDGGNWAWWAFREGGVRALLTTLREECNRSPWQRLRSVVGIVARARLPAFVPRELWSPLRDEAKQELVKSIELFAADSLTKRRLLDDAEAFLARARWPNGTYAEVLPGVFSRHVERELMMWDINGRAAGIEVAYPIATPQVFQLARSSRWSIRRRNGQGRVLLRRASSGWLPDSVLGRVGKLVYNDHFGELWRRGVAQGALERSTLWDECYSEAAWRAARDSDVAAHTSSYVFALYGALALSRWIELNTGRSSGN